jgi:hypothetical protein
VESRDWSDDLMAVFYLSLLIIVAAGSTGSAGINNESVFAQMCTNVSKWVVGSGFRGQPCQV